MWSRWLALFLCLTWLSHSVRAEDALDRLTEKKLSEVHTAVEKLASMRKEMPRPGPYRDYRANLHVHSLLSHDSRITRAEIIEAAKVAGTDILMFSEHPSETYDYVTDGHSGLVDGVLMIPGAETKGMLVYPRQSVKGLDGGSTQELSNLVRGRGGLTFLSHLEERIDLDVPGITGNEIYNTHFDFKTETRLFRALKNPIWWVQATDLFKKYPQECLGALQDYPELYLQRWDELCQTTPRTGVSANDAHQNVGICIRIGDNNRAIVEDALGEKVVELDASVFTLMGLRPRDENGQKVLFKTLLDPYAVSLKHVATHLLMKEQSVPEVWDALEQGRAYVSFDWIANARGFDFAVVPKSASDNSSSISRVEMGQHVSYESEMKIVARAPLSGRWKLVRDGHLIEESDGDAFTTTLTQPGIYRVEVWLDVAGRQQIWILSNPIYVKAAGQ